MKEEKKGLNRTKPFLFGCERKEIGAFAGFLSIWLLCIFVAVVVVVVVVVVVAVGVVIVAVGVVVKSLLKRTQLYSGGVIRWSISNLPLPIGEKETFKVWESGKTFIFRNQSRSGHD